MTDIKQILSTVGTNKMCPVVFIIRNGKLLVGLRHYQGRWQKGKPLWTVPGGRCSPGETLRKTLLREVEEETGIRDLKITDYLGKVPGAKKGDIVFVFLGLTREKARLKESDKFSGWKWCPISKIPRNVINFKALALLKSKKKIPLAEEEYIFNKRKVFLSWFEVDPDPFIKISQVSAFCLFRNKIVLIKNKKGWGIPGGHPEKGETKEETLRRELLEEVNINVPKFDYKILGFMKVGDPQNTGVEGKRSKQIRYLVRLNELPPFMANHEIFERKLVRIKDFAKYVSWGKNPTGKAQLKSLQSTVKE